MADFTNPYFILIMCAEYLAFIVFSTLSVKIFQRYRERKADLALKLFRALIFLAPASISQSFDEFNFNNFLGELFGYKTGLGFSLAFIFSAFSNYFMLNFSYDLFLRKKTILPKILGILDILVCVTFGVFRFQEMLDIGQIFLIIHVLLSWIIYGTIFFLSFRVSRKVDEKITKLSFKLIGSYGICLSLMYILYVYDFIFQGAGSYSIIPAIAWLCGISGGFVAYIGFIRPKWYVKLFPTSSI